MFRDSFVTLTLMGSIALTFLVFNNDEQINWWSTTVTVTQVVQEFNSTKHITARGWEVPTETMPEITEEKVLVSLGQQYASSDTDAEQSRILEAAIRTQRLPACSYIRLLQTDAVAPQAEVQLEICINRCEKGNGLTGDGGYANFAVPFEL